MMYQSLLDITAKYNSKVTLTVNQWSIITLYLLPSYGKMSSYVAVCLVI